MSSIGIRILGLLLAILLPVSAAGAEYRVETVVEGLEHPWSVAWLPDGRLLVTERAGRLRLIEGGRLHPEPVAGVPEAHVHSQAGLFEVLPSPDFTDTGIIYLTLSEGEYGSNTLVLVRGRLQGHRLEGVETLFRAVPERRTSVHYGGRLLLLEDGSLLLTHGDGFDYREQAQDPSSHFGAILRLDRSGRALPDNPFANDPEARPELFSIGHRNVQGIAREPESGIIWAIEHGPRGGDRLHRIIPGENYGWPATSHARDYSGARITPYTDLPGMRSPVHVWRRAIAPAGLILYDGDRFPRWRGDLFAAGLVSRAVHRLRLEEGAVVEEEILFRELDRRLRDVRVGPDGALYLLTDHADGELLRVVPAP